MEALKIFDYDGNGKINTEIIRGILNLKDEKITESEIEAIVKDIDPLDSGAFKYEDYLEEDEDL